MNLHSAIQIYGEFHEFKPFRAILVPAVGIAWRKVCLLGTLVLRGHLAISFLFGCGRERCQTQPSQYFEIPR